MILDSLLVQVSFCQALGKKMEENKMFNTDLNIVILLFLKQKHARSELHFALDSSDLCLIHACTITEEMNYVKNSIRPEQDY